MRKIKVIILNLILFVSIAHSQTFFNVQSGGSNGDDIGNSICKDNSGNIYVTGVFGDSIKFGAFTVKDTIYGEGFLVKYNASGIVQWAKRIGNNGTGYTESMTVKTDKNNNIYLAGQFSGTIKIDTVLVATTTSCMFLAKLNASGNCLWIKSTSGTATEERVNDMDVDTAGNVFLTGHFKGPLTFNNGVSITSVIHPLYLTPSQDCFIAKYNSNGLCQWANSGGGYGTEDCFGIAVRPNGFAYITGYYGGQNTSFSGVALTYLGAADMFIAGYNNAGALQYLDAVSSTDYEAGYDITLDQTGNFYVTGLYDSGVLFDTIAGTPSGSYDMFVAKYNSSGSIVWFRDSYSSQWEQGDRVAVDQNGDIYVGGTFYHGGTTSFPGLDFTSMGYYDQFVVKYNRHGEFQWAQRGGSYSYDYCMGIVPGDSGKVWMTGSYGNTANYGSFALTHNGATNAEDYLFAGLRTDIVTGNISPTVFCAGTSVTVPFICYLPMAAGNVFTAQLSDANGRFANAINIGTLSSTVSGSISAIIPFNTPSGNGYRIRVISSDSLRTGTDNNTNLTVKVTPTANVTPYGAVDFCLGKTVNLSCAVAANQTYQWYNNGTIIPAATDSHFVASATGVYSVQVTNTVGCTNTSSAVSLTLRNKPPSSVTPLSSATFCNGGYVILEANSGSNLHYQWKKNNTNIAGAIDTPACKATTSGIYKVLVSNQYGCTKVSNQVTVTVNPLPGASIIPDGPITFCFGDSVVLHANTNNGSVFKWKKNGNVINNATQQNYTAKTSGKYKVEITNSSGCTSTSAPLVVSVNCKTESESDVEKIIVYPNPTSGELFIDELESGQYRLEVFNAFGQSVYELSKLQNTVNLNMLPAGFYTLRITDNEFIFNKGIIIEK